MKVLAISTNGRVYAAAKTLNSHRTPHRAGNFDLSD